MGSKNRIGKLPDLAPANIGSKKTTLPIKEAMLILPITRCDGLISVRLWAKQ
jgi:hypothetical protein